MTAPKHPVMARWDAWLDAKPGFVLRDEALAFIANEREHHADELVDWLTDSAVSLLTRRTQSVTLHKQRRQAASAFRRAVDNDEPFDGDVRDPFMATYVVNADHYRKRLGDMVADDHLFVADCYRRDGKRAMLLDAFHRAVARRLGDRTTAEVFSVEEYGRLLSSVEHGHRPPELFNAA